MLAPPFWCQSVPLLSKHPAVVACGLCCFCFVHSEFFKMCAAIENPASCEVLSVIRFLLVENHKPIEIHRQLCNLYGNEVMSEVE